MRKLRLGLAILASFGFAGAGSARPQTRIVVHADLPSDKANPGEPSNGNSGPASDGRSANLDAFIEELTTLSNTLDDWDEQDHTPTQEELSKLRSSLPKVWTVETNDGTFTISSGQVDKALKEGKTPDAEAWVDHALGQARSYARQRQNSDRNARQELDRILGTTEFSAVHPPSTWDVFRQRVVAWFARMLGKLFAGIERHPITGEILFWGVLLFAVSFLARAVFHFLVSRDRMIGLTEQEIVVANRTWQEWIRLAKEAAARQDFREAVHSAYWAGIMRLEDLGVLPKDRTKTPREYLRALPRVSQHELAARPLVYSEPLRELSVQLERVWYANRGAQASDFEDTLKQLKALGCQLE